MKNLKATAQFVDKQGKLTPEAFMSLKSSTDEFKTLITAQYQAPERCKIVLPAAVLVNVARGNSAYVITTNQVDLNEGDVMTLGIATNVVIVPL
jgi:hypothetical protein